MITFVDSSAWLDDFRGTASPQSDLLDDLLGREPVVVGDLVLAEVLQGFTRAQAPADRHAEGALARMEGRGRRRQSAGRPRRQVAGQRLVSHQRPK